MILVDTSVWIDFLRGTNSPERHALHRLIEEEEEICLCEIILTEILQGIKDDGDFERVKESLLEFPIIKPRGTETYLKAAEIFRTCRKRGRTIRSTVDCIIAAICVENDIPILHKDRDFDIISSCTKLKVFKVK